MKNLILSALLLVSGAALADVVQTAPTGSPVSDVLLIVGVVAVAALLFIRYRRARNRR